MTTAVGLLLAYVVGSIPFSYLVARRFGVADVRKVGSVNVGATNVLRAAGKTAGLIAFALDALKGAVVALLARRLAPDPALPALAAAAAVLGHMYPVWLGFKGGKGVATGAGAFLPLAPSATGVALVVFGVTAALTRFVSLGSIAGALALVVSTFLLGTPRPVAFAATGIAVLITLKHRSNIERLLGGTEHRLGAPRA